MGTLGRVASSGLVGFFVATGAACNSESSSGGGSGGSTAAEYQLVGVQGDSLQVEEMISALFDSSRAGEASVYSSADENTASDSSLVDQLGDVYTASYSSSLQSYLSYLQAITEVVSVADLDGYSADIGRGGCTVSPEQQAMLDAVNAARIEGRYCASEYYPAVAPLTWNCQLEDAAWAHTHDMVDNNFFAHQGSDGQYAGDRVDEAGYSWLAYGENLAVGFSSESAAMRALLASEGHCVNIMSNKVKEFGSARITGVSRTTNDYTSYWTHVFARQ